MVLSGLWMSLCEVLHFLLFSLSTFKVPIEGYRALKYFFFLFWENYGTKSCFKSYIFQGLYFWDHGLLVLQFSEIFVGF